MLLDELLLVQALLAATAAIVVLCVLMLLQSTKPERSLAKEGKPERRPAERYTDELAA
jgi:hypothetical protein